MPTRKDQAAAGFALLQADAEVIASKIGFYPQVAKLMPVPVPAGVR